MTMKQTGIKVIATAVVEFEGALLVLRRARDFQDVDTGAGLWELPGGSVDPGEKVADAARRETAEEAGIDVAAAATLLDVIDYLVDDGDKSVHRIHVLYGFALRAEPAMKLGDEHSSYLWARSRDEISKLEMVPAIKRFVLERWSR